MGLAVDAGGQLWVANADAGSVAHLSADGALLSTSTVSGTPLRLAAAYGSIWVTAFNDGTVVRIDPDTGRTIRRIPVGQTPEGITAAFGSLWVVLENSATLVQLDPSTMHVVARIEVGEGPRLVTAGAGYLWVSDFVSGRILRIDPRTSAVRSSPHVCAGPQGMHVIASSLWVACTTDNRVVKIATGTVEPAGAVRLPGNPDALAASDDGHLLVGLQEGPAVAEVDVQTIAVTQNHQLGTTEPLYDQANIDVVQAGGTAWVSSYLQGGVYQVPLPN